MIDLYVLNGVPCLLCLWHNSIAMAPWYKLKRATEPEEQNGTRINLCM